MIKWTEKKYNNNINVLFTNGIPILIAYLCFGYSDYRIKFSGSAQARLWPYVIVENIHKFFTVQLQMNVLRSDTWWY
jgi:hypothetical protein